MFKPIFAIFLFVSNILSVPLAHGQTYAGDAVFPSVNYTETFYPTNPDFPEDGSGDVQIEVTCSGTRSLSISDMLVNLSPPSIELTLNVSNTNVTGTDSRFCIDGTDSSDPFSLPTVSVSGSNVTGQSRGISVELSFNSDRSRLTGSVTIPNFLPGQRVGSATLARVGVVACSAPIEPLAQTDPRWNTSPYDSTGTTINAEGCALTALAMAINAEPTATDTDPFRLNQVAAYSGDGWIILGASTTRHQSKLQFVDGRYGNSQNPTAALNFIRQGICENNRPVVLQLPNEGHYVAVYGIDGDQLSAIDPDGGVNRTIYMSETWATRGYVIDPPETHGIFAVLDNGGSLTIVAPDGAETGFRDSTLGIVKNIPNSEYSVDWINDDVTGEEASYRSHNLAVYRPNDGSYQVLIHPTQSGLLNLDVLLLASDGNTTLETSVVSIGTVGTTKTFEIDFKKSGDVLPEIRLLTTFETFRQDLDTAYESGLILDDKVYRLLDRLLGVAEKHASANRSQAARSVLKTVRKTIQKHITNGAIVPNAGTALIAAIDGLDQ